MPHKSECDEKDEEEKDQFEETQDLTILPLVTFGVLTDVQYANVDDGKSYDQKRNRYYRNSLNLVQEAISNWKLNQNLKFLIQLGDLIDGKSKPINDSLAALDTVLKELKKLFTDSTQEQILHIWGNHEFYNFTRKEILELPLNTAKTLSQNVNAEANYYIFDVTTKLRLICLDYYKYSALGYDETDEIYKNAFELLSKHNKNEDKNSYDNLRGHAQRYTKFNGGLGDIQFEWFKEQLKICKENDLKVIVCGHLPIHAQASDNTCLAWDSKKVLELLWSYDTTVVAYFAGHDHQGGYFRDKRNIHHITFAAILETPSNSNAYATVKVYDNKVSVEGVGMIGYYEIYFN